MYCANFSFVISMEFRALSPNGILFMATNNDTSQFVSLELVDGKIVYQFNTGSALVRMRTNGIYTVGGIWYKVGLNLCKLFLRNSLTYYLDRTDLLKATDLLQVVNFASCLQVTSLSIVSLFYLDESNRYLQ